MGSATTYRCPPHTVYVGRKGTLDNPFMMLEPCWNIDTVFGLVAEDVLGPMYLYRFCQNTDFKKLDPASGRPSVKSSSILALEIPLPSLEEQEAIVEKLEAASRVCKAVEAQAREGLVLCEQLRTAFLREAFSDE